MNRFPRHVQSILIIIAMSLTASGCSGRSLLPTASSAFSETTLATAGLAANLRRAVVRFSIAVPGRTKSRSARRRIPAYVSASTVKAVVIVRGQNEAKPEPPQTFACTSVCTGGISAPVGIDLFRLQLEDKKSRVLSIGVVTILIFQKSNNLLTFTLDGVVASVNVVPLPARVPVVPASQGFVLFDARDADGNIVTPDGNYVDQNGNPLVFDIKSSAKALRLGVTTVSAPGMPIPFTYNGSLHVGSVSITPSAHTGVKTSVAFHVAKIAFIPGIAQRIAPPLPVNLLTATQVPVPGGKTACAGLPCVDEDALFLLGDVGNQTAALKFDVKTGGYGRAELEQSGGPYANPPIDLGAGNGFFGYVQFGENDFGYEYIAGYYDGLESGGFPNACGGNGTPIGHSAFNGLPSGNVYCQFDGVPGKIWDATGGVFVAYGQDRKIENIGGRTYFVTTSDVLTKHPQQQVYSTSTGLIPVPGAITVGANVTAPGVVYYGDADGTVRIAPNIKVAKFNHAVEDVIGHGSKVYVYENDGIFGFTEGGKVYESDSLPIGTVLEVVTGVNAQPMLVEQNGTLDVLRV